MNNTKRLIIAVTILLTANFSFAECDDRSSIAASIDASDSILGGESVKQPVVLKRHHPSKRKEVATYYRRGNLYYTLYFLVGNNCQAQFIKRSRGKY